MTVSTSTMHETRTTQPAPWWEIVVIIVFYLFVTRFVKGLAPILPIFFLLYMVVEGRLRHRTWADYGFRLRTIPAGIHQTLGWALLVIFGTQALFVFGEYFFLPEVFQHIAARLPFDLNAINANLVITLVIGTFLEELIFRALFQSRLSAFVAPGTAIGLAALAFALAHYSPGSALVVFVDLLSVFVDGVLYGLIYHRSRNIFVSWIPHFLADVVALFLLLALK